MAWEDESTLYTYATIGDPVNNFSAVGHYTQLVWANTTQVGCGVTQCTTNSPFGGGTWNYVVCRYSPPGNFTGQFPYVRVTASPTRLANIATRGRATKIAATATTTRTAIWKPVPVPRKAVPKTS